MKLWSGTLSPFSAKVRIVAAEKGIDLEIAEIPWSRANLWGPKPEAFLAVSPRGEVPVLELDGSAVVDSTLINEYFEDAYPANPMMPLAALAKAQCRMWEDLADEFMATRITVLVAEVFMKADDTERDHDAIAEVHAAFGTYLDRLEAQLSGQDWLCDEYSVADVATWICFAFAGTLGVGLDKHPAVGAWYARVYERPAVAAEYNAIIGAAAAA